MLRDKLLARLDEMGSAPDHQRLAAEVLGIRGAPPDLARRLVAQALVLEDRRDEWRRAGERICREIPAVLRRDVLVLVPSVEPDSVELVAARAGGEWRMQRTRRNGADLAVHTQRMMRFFKSPLRDRAGSAASPLAPIVFSWLAHRGAAATRVDPHDARDARELRKRLAALLRDERLFRERLHQC